MDITQTEPTLDVILDIDKLEQLAGAVNKLKELPERRLDEANMVFELYDAELTEQLFTISTWATSFIESLQ